MNRKPLHQVMTIRVRLIALCADHLLTAFHIPTKTRFLLGGGLEHGESSISCLHREIAEETDLVLHQPPAFLGLLENRFQEDGKDIHEILPHFLIELDDATPRPVASREAALRFEWIPLDRLEDVLIWPPETVAIVQSAAIDQHHTYYSPLRELA